jgi:hypothetical protein
MLAYDMLLPVTAIPLYINPPPYNAFVSRVLVVADFCAKMAEGHAQKEAKTKTSTGQTCYT